MAGFWFFFAGATREAVVAGDLLRRDFLRSRGLDGVLADVRQTPAHAVVHATSAGVLVYPLPVSGDVPRHVGAMDRLTWREVRGTRGADAPGSPGYRLGWDQAAPPEPATLERRELVSGYTIKDALGRSWQVPVLRSADNPRGRLGVSFSWDDDDEPQIGVERRYAEIWERSGRVWDMIDRATDSDPAFLAQSFTADEDRFLLAYVLDCLAINYRVGRAVWGTLDRLAPDWLSQGVASVMLDATLDLWKYRAFIEAQKKSAS